MHRSLYKSSPNWFVSFTLCLQIRYPSRSNILGRHPYFLRSNWTDQENSGWKVNKPRSLLGQSINKRGKRGRKRQQKARERNDFDYTLAHRLRVVLGQAANKSNQITQSDSIKLGIFRFDLMIFWIFLKPLWISSNEHPKQCLSFSQTYHLHSSFISLAFFLDLVFPFPRSENNIDRFYLSLCILPEFPLNDSFIMHELKSPIFWTKKLLQCFW